MHEGLNFVLEQWASDIVYWETYSIFGVEGALSFVIIMGFFILFLYEKICLFLSGNIAISKILTFFFGIASAPLFFLTRPQVISTFIFMLEVYLLLKYAKTNDKKYLYFIPLFSLLIVNFHCALWPMIFILTLPFIATFSARKLTNISDEYLGANFNITPIFVAVVASFFIAFINPYGFKAMAFLFTSYDPNIHSMIGEIKPMALMGNLGSFFFVWLFSGIVLLSKKKMPLYLILLFSGLAFLALLAGRNLFLFYALGTFAFAYGLKNYEPKITKLNWGFLHILPFLIIDLWLLYSCVKSDDIFPLPKIILIYLSLIFISLIAFILCYKKENNLSKTKWLLTVILPFLLIICLTYHNEISAKDYTDEKYKTSIDMLLSKKEPKDIKLFAGFNTGSYPEFRKIKSYIDGRPEIFAPKNSGKDFSYIEEYLSVTGGKTYYRDFVKKYDFNYMLVEEGDGILFVMLPYDKDFILLHEEKDKYGKVYARLYEVKIDE